MPDLQKFDRIETVGELRRILADLADETPCFDVMGEPICVSVGKMNHRVDALEMAAVIS